MSGLLNIQENNEQVLNDIQSLQQMEQQLFSSLENNPNITQEQQQKIIEKMNELSNMRLNLYQTLSSINGYTENALNTSVNSLRQQAIAIEIVERELNNAKERLRLLEEEKNNKIRLVEINTYFGDKYAEHTQLMKIIIYTLIPVAVLSFLKNKLYMPIPNQLYYILIGIIALIGGYFFWTRYFSMIMRDNMNYQEFNWPFAPGSLNNATSGDSTDPWATSNFGTCIGNACCSNGLVYDMSLNQCTVPSTTPANNTSTNSVAATAAPTTSSVTTRENFTTVNNEDKVLNVLTKNQPNKFKVDYDLREPKPINQ